MIIIEKKLKLKEQQQQKKKNCYQIKHAHQMKGKQLPRGSIRQKIKIEMSALKDEQGSESVHGGRADDAQALSNCV